MSEFKINRVDNYTYQIVKDGLVSYIVKRGDDNKLSCSCPGFKYRSECKHVRAVSEEYPNDSIDSENKTHPRSIVEKIIPYLSKSLNFWSKKWEIVGSYRRGCPNIKDIDLIVYQPDILSWDLLIDEIENCFSYRRVVRGDSIARGYFQGILIDINRVQLKSEWASQLLYRTGSAAHNIKMRSIAKQKGLLLNEHGLYRVEDGSQISEDTWNEKSYFDYLGIKYLNPEDR